MSFPAIAEPNRPPSSVLSGLSLEAKMVVLDTDFFDAYNQCDLRRFGDYMVPNVEFLHDQGGLMLSRAMVVAATKKYICGKVRRELVPGSLRVYPIKNYGALAMGEHRFCELATQQCVGIAKFTHVWRERNGKWQMTRILSYDHQPLKP
ncbi:MAG: nuclear transport factor 2 family protein [Burkholderiales bacterium]|nr:MAG: nuclear transport factor 2 family protein [Betaproteobacteria bacterium]TAG83897.1 MAG: nuclear transport factor 2 family protein [Burkholderiales bacterium]